MSATANQFDKGWLEETLSSGVDEGVYREWLRFHFDRPEGEWYWDDDALIHEVPPEFEAEMLTRLIGLTFSRSGKDLGAFTDAQVGYGLNYMLMCGSQSGKVHDKSVSRLLKEALLRATHILYAECFETRCAPVADADASMLNYIAYILCEFPIGYWGLEQESCLKALQLEVCERILLLDNPACAYGAMHTLNHFYCTPHEERIERAIKGYVARHPDIPSELKAYARGAIAHSEQ